MHLRKNIYWLLKRLGRLVLLFLIVMFLIFMVFWVFVTQPTFTKIQRKGSPVTVDPVRLEAHVRMLAERFRPRGFEHPENLDEAAAYIMAELERAGGECSEQPYETDGRKYRNVIAFFGPDTDERVVVGAHYDAVGDMPGADDNASGVAGLIELARALGSAELPMRVELVAYTLEEPPYFMTLDMGSAVHARSLKDAGKKVKLMIALEMIGYFSDKPKSQDFPIPGMGIAYPTTANFIAVVGKTGQGKAVRRVRNAMAAATELPVESLSAPRFVPGVDFSDHHCYWDVDYQAVMITDTAFFRNTRYHGFDDTPDTLDYERMALVVQGVYAAVIDAVGK